MKSCTVCSIELTPENQKDYHKKNYVHKCIECVRGVSRPIARKSYAKNKDVSQTRSNKYNIKNKEERPKYYTARQMQASSKKRASKKGWDYDLTTDYIESLMGDTCPILKEKLQYGGAKSPFSASLDRIDSSKGYTKDNVWIISSLSNTMKSNATVEQLKIFGKWCCTLEEEKLQGKTK